MIGLENYENILKESCLFHNKDTAELAELCRLLGGKIQDYGKGQQLLPILWNTYFRTFTPSSPWIALPIILISTRSISYDA